MNFKLLFSCFCLVILSACAANTDYLEAKTLPPIDPPEDLDKERLGQLYPVPEQNDTEVPDSFSVPLPPTVSVQSDSDGVSIQAMEGELWLLSSSSAATTWTQLVNFWQQKQVALVERDLKAATMTSDWFDEAIQPGYQIRYRLQLQQGFQTGTTEVFIYNEKIAVAAAASATPALGQVADRAHANLFARQLVASLSQNNVADSYLAATIKLPEKVRLDELDGEPVLLALASSARLKRVLPSALGEDGLLLYAQSLAGQNLSIYHFDKDKPKTFAAWLAAVGVNVESSSDSSLYPLEEILASLPNEPEVNALFTNLAKGADTQQLEEVQGYLLVLRQVAQGQEIYIRDAYGRRLAADEAKALLDNIRLRLI